MTDSPPPAPTNTGQQVARPDPIFSTGHGVIVGCCTSPDGRRRGWFDIYGNPVYFEDVPATSGREGERG